MRTPAKVKLDKVGKPTIETLRITFFGWSNWSRVADGNVALTRFGELWSRLAAPVAFRKLKRAKRFRAKAAGSG